jgi:cation diffusion facilitator family transporter
MTPTGRIGRNVALSSVVISAGLATAKILVGLKAHSTAVVSDGLESASDVLASGLVLFGLIMAAKPPDAEHPYGHGRLETLSGLAVGMILTAMGVLIAVESLQRALRPHGPPLAFGMWPVGVSVVVKGGLYFVKRRYSRKLGSTSLAADAWNDAMDTLSGSIALIGVALESQFGSRFGPADDVGGCVVGVIIVYLGIHIVRETTSQLMDTMPDASMLEPVREIAKSVPGALGIEKCYARKTGLQYHIDLHLEVDPEMTVSESHEIATAVRARLRQRLPWVADVLVHVEPHGLDTMNRPQAPPPHGGATDHDDSLPSRDHPLPGRDHPLPSRDREGAETMIHPQRAPKP